MGKYDFLFTISIFADSIEEAWSDANDTAAGLEQALNLPVKLNGYTYIGNSATLKPIDGSPEDLWLHNSDS